MNTIYSYPITMYERILVKMYVFLVLHVFTIFAFYHNKFYAKIANKYFLPQACVHLDKIVLIHCSQRTVAHVHVIVFSLKFTQHATVTQTESNQEITKND